MGGHEAVAVEIMRHAVAKQQRLDYNPEEEAAQWKQEEADRKRKELREWREKRDAEKAASKALSDF